MFSGVGLTITVGTDGSLANLTASVTSKASVVPASTDVRLVSWSINPYAYAVWGVPVASSPVAVELADGTQASPSTELDVSDLDQVRCLRGDV